MFRNFIIVVLITRKLFQELPESNSREVHEAIQSHALSELRVLCEKFEGKLNIVQRHRSQITDLKQRLHFISSSPSVMVHAGYLVPFLGRFNDTVDMPHERMYWNSQRSQFTGILSPWFANGFIANYARFILEYDPNISSKVYHLV